MAPKSVTFRRHDHLVSVLFGDLLSHSYNITFSMFLDLVQRELDRFSWEWNTHRIRPSSTSCTVGGIPKELYFAPESAGRLGISILNN